MTSTIQRIKVTRYEQPQKRHKETAGQMSGGSLYEKCGGRYRFLQWNDLNINLKCVVFRFKV